MTINRPPPERQEQIDTAIRVRDRIDRLAKNEDFLWFMAMAIEKPWQQYETQLHELDTTPEERQVAAYLAKAFKTAKEWLPEQRKVQDSFIPKT